MKCCQCEKNFRVKDIFFLPNGVVPKSKCKRYDAYCSDCVKDRGKPIDETSK